MCDMCRQKQHQFSTTPQLKTCWVQACFGFAAWPRWVARVRRLPIGKSSATEPTVVSLR